MSQLKLKHSGGNSVIIAAPSSNPAADRTLTLPGNADGTILTTGNSTLGKVLQVVQTTKTDQHKIMYLKIFDLIKYSNLDENSIDLMLIKMVILVRRNSGMLLGK